MSSVAAMPPPTIAARQTPRIRSRPFIRAPRRNSLSIVPKGAAPTLPASHNASFAQRRRAPIEENTTLACSKG